MTQSNVLQMTNLDLAGQRVLIRQDLNVPMLHNMISNDARIRAAIPTLQKALKAGAAVMVASHLGRPQEGIFDHAHSLAPVAERLSELLQRNVPLIKDWLYPVDIKPGDIVLCENVRFNVGEKENCPKLAKQMASLCDIFVMDAFATAHRAEASTCGISHYAKTACAGPLLANELDALGQGLATAKAPIVAIVGGSKVSTKLAVLDSLANKVDTLIVGGGIANTFVAAAGLDIGKSLYEPDLLDEAERLLQTKNKASIPQMEDAVLADSFSADADTSTRLINEVDADDKIFDIGPKTIAKYTTIIRQAKTILWNGPLGAFEIPAFSEGTRAIAHAIAESDAFSIAGGGDTIAAIDQYQLADKISYISTGGGAFLRYLEGKPLPAVTALQENNQVIA
jgi:phosphoglycerate kinase